ncbi:MAG: shikimate kinase [Alphaproteobacteria bacterium]|nr:shikimate kinase [Alphaproteobacteria bacterium]MBP7759653.1 shikimate kinase [Alphaproteobacteria bacterium]MBP7763003.1 shikimate kinase [Alphaproteobacteria bacterium]MBP7904438.1 shikimate kinase [Alphaproteobacteria bacterium]
MNEHSRQPVPLADSLRSRLRKPLVLLGMMGSGKSHAGAILSALLDLPHYDSDKLIEAKEGRTISDIFAETGEAVFRALEHATIVDLLDRGPCVLSTGGGCVTVPQTLSAIHDKGISVWLKADVETLYERLKKSKNRPLLDCEDPKDRLTNLLAQREGLYARADITVEKTEGGIDELVAAILQSLAEYIDDDH